MYIMYIYVRIYEYQGGFWQPIPHLNNFTEVATWFLATVVSMIMVQGKPQHMTKIYVGFRQFDKVIQVSMQYLFLAQTRADH